MIGFSLVFLCHFVILFWIDKSFFDNDFCLLIGKFPLSKMKILQTVSHYFGDLGISPSQKTFRFNIQNILTLVLYIQLTCASIAYLVYSGTKLVEYVDCLYTVATVLGNIVVFSSNVWKSPRIFKLIRDVETTVEKRKPFSYLI